jgi:predicted kinase
VRPRLQARGRAGLIRNIHGDLHLGNIALIDGAPVLFDAIEFNPLIASGDLLYDLAFLLMDLVERGLQPAANAVLNRYLSETRRDDDLDALAALPLFLALRAAIRAKVTAAVLEHAEPAQANAIRQPAAAYFRLAQTLIAPPRPMLVAIGGLSGTGKSRLAHTLAPRIGPAPGAVILRSDVERKAMYGRPETAPLPAQAYAPAVTGRLYAMLAEKAVRIVAAGHSAVLDAVFAQPQERSALAAAARAAGTEVRGLFLTAPTETRVARVDGRAADASDADAAIARQQESYALGAIDWTIVDASGTPDETLARAEAALRGQRTPV